MRNRNQIIDAAVSFMESLIGLRYSRTYRYRWYKGGSTDCSGFVYGAYLAAGFPLLVDGVERSTSTYEVYADGFDLIFPTSRDIIGKTFAPKGFYRDFKFEKGDLIFYSFGSTTRANKITHVAMCYDAEHIIHTANTRENACIKPLSYGDGNIVAVTRLNPDAQEMKRNQIKRSVNDKPSVRRMQALLNTFGNALNCDGVWGSKTQTAVKKFQNSRGLEDDGICGKLTWAALTREDEKTELSETLNICTFNVKRAAYKNGTPKKTGEIITDAHIACIQEVTPDGLKKIAAAAGLKAYMCDTIGGYGHAILTNLSADDEEITALAGSGERRKLHRLRFSDVSVYNAHLHYTEPTNTNQLMKIADILSKDNSRVIILAGDFNRQEFGEIVKLGFTQVNTGQLIRNTEGGSSKSNKIDNIFVKGAKVNEVWKCEAVKNKWSDHDALFCEVSL